MYASDRARFGKTPLLQRRGIYLSRYPDSWFQFALRNASEAVSLKKRLRGIGHVFEDVTQSVFDKTFRSPPGAWTLLVHLKAGSWSVMPMMQQSPAIMDELGKMIDGEYMIIRHSDCSGVYSVMRFRDGQQVDHIYSDGGLWHDEDDEDFYDEDEDEEPDNEDGDSSIDSLFNGVESDNYTLEWLMSQSGLFSAMHQIMTDWDALIPDYWWDEEHGLGASQKQLFGKQLIKRIDLIRFGEIDHQANEDASRRLRDAIHARDVDGVRQALADRASLTQFPDTDDTALDLLCNFLPAEDKNVVEIAELLLAAGAAADGKRSGTLGKPAKGASGGQTPLSQTVAAHFASPRMMFELARLLVRHGAVVTAETKQGLDDSPLEAAFNRADVAWMTWMLNFDQPVELLQKLLEQHRRGVKQMASHVDEQYASQQRERYQPIVEMVERAIAGNGPDDSAIEAMIDEREAEYRQQRGKIRGTGAKLASAMERLAATYATEEINGKKVLLFDGFDVTKSWIANMPCDVKLLPAELGSWTADHEVQCWADAFAEHAFKPVGHFRDQGGWVELIAYCQPFRDLYGVIEKIGDDRRLRIIRRRTGERYLIATNQKRMWNQTPAKIEVDWVTHRDATHMFVRPILSATKESESASIDQFVEHYENAHRHLRERLRDVAI